MSSRKPMHHAQTVHQNLLELPSFGYTRKTRERQLLVEEQDGTARDSFHGIPLRIRLVIGFNARILKIRNTLPSIMSRDFRYYGSTETKRKRERERECIVTLINLTRRTESWYVAQVRKDRPYFHPANPTWWDEREVKGKGQGFIVNIRDIEGRREEGSENLEYIFKCIFHATNFGRVSPPPLVEICNSFEPVLAGNRRRKEQTGEHYHLYEILCASLCIVIIQPLFPGCWRRRRRRRKVTRPIQYKLPCGRR